MNLRAACLALVACLWGALPSLGATSALYKVELKASASSDDMQGAALVFAVREQIRASKGFTLDSSGSHYIIFVSTLDPDKKGELAHLRTSYATVFVFYNASTHQQIFLDGGIALAGKDRIDESARLVLADLETAIEAGK